MTYTKEIVSDVLDRIQRITRERGDEYLRDIYNQTPAIQCTCPYHKNHSEDSPSCGVFIEEHATFHIGDFYCFACHASGSFVEFVSDCLDIPYADGEQWLEENYGKEFPSCQLMDEFNFEEDNDEDDFLNDCILTKYNKYNDYMWERKLTKEVVDKFHIGYDDTYNKNVITFPVWDERGRLKFITARSIKSKKFYIPKDVEKPLYLLNYIMENNITNQVYVCESQINTLTCYVYGKNAVGLFGTGTQPQVDLLNRSGVHHFILALDPDDAGRKGTVRLIENLNMDKMIDVMIIPQGKDINDLSKEEFDSCEIVDADTWLEREHIKTNIKK